MAHVLLIVNGLEEKIHSVVLEILTWVNSLDREVQISCFVIGRINDDLTLKLQKYGADHIYHSDDDQLVLANPLSVFKTVLKLVDEIKPKYVFSGASYIEKELLSRLAAKKGKELFNDVTSILMSDDSLEIQRPIYAGKIEAFYKGIDDQIYMSFRNGIVDKVQEKNKEPDLQQIQVVEDLKNVIVNEMSISGKKAVDLTDAEIIVTGGRGLGSPENFSIIEDLAHVLGGTVGATRAVVDLGWRPYTEQIGQTGKVVTPKLYFACALSGAVQHLVGMSSSKYVVAINKDREAPIFSHCDLGIVGDVFKVLPALTEELKKVLNKSGS